MDKDWIYPFRNRQKKSPSKKMKSSDCLVDLLGLEPRIAEPKTAVLPITP